MLVVWAVTTYELLGRYRRFEQTRCLYLPSACKSAVRYIPGNKHRHFVAVRTSNHKRQDTGDISVASEEMRASCMMTNTRTNVLLAFRVQRF
jgi:hypothetical protein